MRTDNPGFIILADIPPEPNSEDLLRYKASGIQYYVHTQDFCAKGTPEYFNALDVCSETDTDVFMRGYNSGSFFDDFGDKIRNYPAVKGFYYWDEPTADKFAEISETLVPFHNEKYSDKYFHINLYPDYTPLATLKTSTYEEYVKQYVDQVLSKVSGAKSLTVDYYNIWNIGLRASNLRNYEVVSRQAKRCGADFGICIQTLLLEEEISRQPSTKRDITFQLNVGLAFGARVFEYFTYGTNEHVDYQPGKGYGMIRLDGQKSDVYDFVTSSNAELAELEKTYCTFDHRDVYTYIGSVTSDAQEAFSLMTHNKDNHPEKIQEISSTGDLVVGEFVSGETYAYYLTNYTDPIADGAIDVKIHAEPGMVTMFVDGQWQNINCESGTLNLKLPSGTGAFLIMGRANEK